MKTLKKYLKYVLWVVGIYILTAVLIFIGFNANYKPLKQRESLPEIISIDKAEATKSQGRIYGHIKNTPENDLNGKYIKISIYNSNNENIETQYLKIENLEPNTEKLFKGTFIAENAKSYEINVVDNN